MTGSGVKVVVMVDATSLIHECVVDAGWSWNRGTDYPGLE